MGLFIYLLIYFNLFVPVVLNSFKDVTNEVFSDGTENGVLAAFGDFTGDRKVDLFVISDGGKTVNILANRKSLPIYWETSFSCTLKEPNLVITSVVPGDFNNDTDLDVLITVKEKSSSEENVKVKIFRGFRDKINCSAEDEVLSMKGQPLTLDFNGDGIIDLFGEDDEGQRSLWQIQNHTFVRTDFLVNPNGSAITYPNSNAFVDLNGDLIADILITTKKSFEFWINKKGKYVHERNVDKPNVFRFYQVGFCDISASGVLNLIAPACNSEGCDDSAIYAFHEQKWHEIGSDFYYDDQRWKFLAPENEMKSMVQPTLRIADINMDGFPDLMTTMYSNVDKVMRSMVFIMLNVPTKSNHVGRKFNISYAIDIQNATTAAFHDIYNNGKMDLLITAGSSYPKEWKIHVFKNTMAFDAYFLKVIVLSGKCRHNCPRDTVSYGVNTPGPCVRITTTNSEGLQRYGTRALFPQSAYFALHLPYMLFGLGQSPNFVNTLKIGLPENSSAPRYGEWKQIIPNSQVVIIPYPIDKPSRWHIELFVTPSRIIILSSCALMGTCVLIIIIILILHWREKREDHRERQQDAHRFHFNAM